MLGGKRHTQTYTDTDTHTYLFEFVYMYIQIPQILPQILKIMSARMYRMLTVSNLAILILSNIYRYLKNPCPN